MAVLTPRSGRVRALGWSVLAAVGVGLAAPERAPAQALTRDEALELAFAGAERIERRTAYLDEADLARLAEAAGPGVDVEASVVPYYVAWQDGAPVGVAYFDAHRVRTLQEVLMVVVGPGGVVRRVEVVAFAEPPEYRAPDGWLDLFEGRGLKGDLARKDAVPNLTGATLTADAVADAVRRSLALHAHLRPLGGGRR